MTLLVPFGRLASSASVPVLAAKALGELIVAELAAGARLLAYLARPDGAGHRVLAVLGRPGTGLVFAAASVEGELPSVAMRAPAAQLFEREMAESHGIVPVGHPWPKPVRFPRGGVGVMPYFSVGGAEVHEVAVGPVHAGVIEPGHFRFECHGERVLHLEISLGYQHRGGERLLATPGPRALAAAETLAGDTTIGHALAHARVLEILAGAHAPPRAAAIRGIALELERLANHTGDLGALAGDVGFLPTAAYCGRIRGDFLNLTAELCGSRLGRGLIRPGGVGFDVEPERAERVAARLETARRDVTSAVELLFGATTVLARFEGTGTLPAAACAELGVVGVAARAAGLELDARADFPGGLFRFAQIPVSTASSGDVFARAMVRWLEIGRSIQFCLEQLDALPRGDVVVPCGAPAPGSVSVSVIEGWRGEICHVAETDEQGAIAAYKVVDPSFHNWFGLAYALRNQQISDFPLCNKSFNLSYCGHDL